MTTERKPIPPLTWWQRRFWSQRHDYARLERELALFWVDIELFERRTVVEHPSAETMAERKPEDNTSEAKRGAPHETPKTAWAKAAGDAALCAHEYLVDKRNIEGGWTSLHAARRHVILCLSTQELLVQASILRAEAKDKIPGWRGKEMVQLLPEASTSISAHQVIAAMALRDEHFSNQYHKIWLIGSQITILLVSCGIGGVFFFLPLVVYSSWKVPGTSNPWGFQMIGAVLFFGLLGAAFSAAGSLMSADATAKIPERVANQFVTTARALFGSGLALAGYAFYQSKSLNLHFGDDMLPGSALAVAFLFGFGGEVLIARVLGTLGASKPQMNKEGN